MATPSTQHGARGGRRLAALATSAGAGLTLLLGLGGCYQRVVDARGPGADQVELSEPYAEDTALDRWLFGEPTGTRGQTPLERGNRTRR